jgi:hypothetical protein
MCLLLCLCYCLNTHTTLRQRLFMHSIGVDDLPLALTGAPVSANQPTLSPTTSGTRSSSSECVMNASWPRTTPTHTQSSSRSWRPRTATRFVCSMQASEVELWTTDEQADTAGCRFARKHSDEDTGSRPTYNTHTHPNISHLNNWDVGHSGRI